MHRSVWFVIFLFLFSIPASSQSVTEYTVRKVLKPIQIDGRLSEPAWEKAAYTERFVLYRDGAPARLSTQAKMLWDNDRLYIGFVCEDPDVRAEMKKRDDPLWREDVVEIFCDPDGDGINYFEVQMNPLATVMDLLMNKPYSIGGRGDWKWNLQDLKTAVWIGGTLNDLSGIDSLWTCEVALPFSGLAPLAPSLHFPPKPGDSWRILLARYDYEKTENRGVEISSWKRTDARGFHVPEKFGRIVFK